MRTFVFLGCIAVALSVGAGLGSPAEALPTLLTQFYLEPSFAVRPAVLVYTGDGSVLLGGLQGTGKSGSFGHIAWSSWTKDEAVGYGVAWEKCFDARGCPKPYFLEQRQLITVHASNPVDGHFIRLTFIEGTGAKRNVCHWRIRRLPGVPVAYEYAFVKCDG